MSKNRKIPVQQAPKKDTLIPNNHKSVYDDKLVFSFEIMEQNEFFGMDKSHGKWARGLVLMLKDVSNITVKRFYSGEFSGRNTTLRIHRHKNANFPCPLPKNVSEEELYQIRKSKGGGGIHGFLIDNVFYVIWLDPNHNLYPDDKHGGIKKIKQ